MQFLKNNSIGTIKQWGGFSIPHFKNLGYSIENYPSTEKLFNKLLLLPLNHMMNKTQAEIVARKILEFFN